MSSPTSPDIHNVESQGIMIVDGVNLSQPAPGDSTYSSGWKLWQKRKGAVIGMYQDMYLEDGEGVSLQQSMVRKAPILSPLPLFRGNLPYIPYLDQGTKGSLQYTRPQME